MPTVTWEIDGEGYKCEHGAVFPMRGCWGWVRCKDEGMGRESDMERAMDQCEALVREEEGRGYV